MLLLHLVGKLVSVAAVVAGTRSSLTESLLLLLIGQRRSRHLGEAGISLFILLGFGIALSVDNLVHISPVSAHLTPISATLFRRLLGVEVAAVSFLGGGDAQGRIRGELAGQ